MENRNIIIALLIIVVVILAAMLAMVLMPSTNAQKDCKLLITSDSQLYEGDNLTVKLSDIDGKAIANQQIDIVVIADDGTKNSHSVITDSNGTGTLELNGMIGNYTVNITFSGNENFTANSTSQKLEIKEVVVESEPQPVQESSGSSDEIHYDKELNVYYNSEGIVVDPDGKHPMEVGRQYSELAERREKWERGELEM